MKYRVRIRSRPGHYAQYDGNVDVCPSSRSCSDHRNRRYNASVGFKTAETRQRSCMVAPVQLHWGSFKASLLCSKSPAIAANATPRQPHRPAQEVGDLPWHEFDLDKRVWSLPSKRAKNGHAGDVHLSDLAIEIIGRLPRFVGFVFRSPASSRCRAIRRQGGDR
jgi:hypothetical protein